MTEKVILISIDGVRADALEACQNPYIDTLKELGSYAPQASSVMPSVTLPCHMSMFHSVEPKRHGIMTNIYTPQVRPINGLFEQVKNAGRTAAMFYGWEPLRGVARPDSLLTSEFLSARSADHTDAMLADRALKAIEQWEPDFVFLYMVETDEKGGHDCGWMSEQYLDYVSRAFDNVKRVIEAVGDRYTVIVTADHGGHDRIHGTDLPEDMLIPMFFVGPSFEPGKELQDVSLLELAPTIAKLLDIRPAKEWEGRSLV